MAAVDWRCANGSYVQRSESRGGGVLIAVAEGGLGHFERQLVYLEARATGERCWYG